MLSTFKVLLLSKGLLHFCTRQRFWVDSQTVTEFVSKLVDGLSSCLLKKYCGMSIFWEATLLDPQFKEHNFPQEGHRFRETKDVIVNKCCTVRNRLINMQPSAAVVGMSSSSQTSSNVWQDFDTAVGGLIQNQADSPSI